MKAYRMVILDEKTDETIETSSDDPIDFGTTLDTLQQAYEDRNQIEGTRLVEIEGSWLLLAPLGNGGGVVAIIQMGDVAVAPTSWWL